MTRKTNLSSMQEIAIKDIEIGGLNIRKFYDEEKLKELTSSFSTIGQLQPVVVRPLKKRGL